MGANVSMLGVSAQEAIAAGTALQIALADDEGLVMENLGDRFPQENLIAALLGAESTVDRLQALLKVGPPSEIVIRLKHEDIAVCGRFFDDEDGSYLLALVVPRGSLAGMLAHRIIHEFQSHKKRKG